MNLWRELEPGRKVPLVVTSVTVTPKDSVNVYVYHAHSDLFALAQIIHTPFRPPGDMGFVPRTYTEGNAPLDTVVLSSSPNAPRTVLDARPVALLRMSVDNVRDDRVVCVPEMDELLKDVTDVRHVSPHTLEDIRRFFETLFQAQGKIARIDDWLGADEAQKAIERAIGLYKRKFQQPEM